MLSSIELQISIKVNSFGKHTDIGNIFVWRYDKDTLFGHFWNDNISGLMDIFKYTVILLGM